MLLKLFSSHSFAFSLSFFLFSPLKREQTFYQFQEIIRHHLFFVFWNHQIICLIQEQVMGLIQVLNHLIHLQDLKLTWDKWYREDWITWWQIVPFQHKLHMILIFLSLRYHQIIIICRLQFFPSLRYILFCFFFN